MDGNGGESAYRLPVLQGLGEDPSRLPAFVRRTEAHLRLLHGRDGTMSPFHAASLASAHQRSRPSIRRRCPLSPRHADAYLALSRVYQERGEPRFAQEAFAKPTPG